MWLDVHRGLFKFELVRECLTLALMSTLAPFCSRYLTTSAWPALAAMCSAVSPLYNTKFASKTFHDVHVISKL